MLDREPWTTIPVKFRMPTVVQASTMSGSIIDKARWMVPLQGAGSVQISHPMAICIDTDDKDILSYVKKQAKKECAADQIGNRNFISITFVVDSIRHMIDGKKFDTMMMVIPEGKYAERVALYLLDPEKCEKRFVEAVRHR